MNWLQVKNDDRDDDDDNDANSKDVQVVEVGTGQALTILDRLVKLKDQSKEGRNSLAATNDKLEKLRVRNKNQNHISYYFMLE